MFDVIVVGARCAGATVARLLAERGHRVLLVDRARFPSDTMSTLFIQPRTIRRWGLAEPLRASGCPPIGRWQLVIDDLVVAGTPWAEDGATDAYAPRRTVLDALLVERAVAAGVELREQTTVDELIRDGDRVSGVRLRGQGAGEAVGARLVIGADGVRSTVAAAVGAARTQDRPALNCGFYSFFEGLPVAELITGVRNGQNVAVLPTHAGHTLVYVGFPRARFHEVRADLDGAFVKTLDDFGDLGQRLRAARRVERIVGTDELPNFVRQAWGPGWALVGDAGYHKDPITAQGISDALEHAGLLADAADAGLAGRMALDQALAAYQEERDRGLAEMFAWTVRVAALGAPSAETRALLAAVARDPAACGRFLGVYSGTVSVAEFFARDNLARLVAAG